VTIVCLILAILMMLIETIVLHAIPDAVDFYIKNSFIPLDKYYSLHDNYTEGCVPMYMELF